MGNWKTKMAFSTQYSALVRLHGVNVAVVVILGVLLALMGVADGGELVLAGTWGEGDGDGPPNLALPQAARIKLAAAQKTRNEVKDFIPARIPRAPGWIFGLLFEA
jgi:hypothetical protein